MQSGEVAKTIARWAALGALFLIPFAPLIVADTYFFPFITGKAFYLRILIEIAVGGWIVLAFLDKEYRPRFSWVGAAFVGFVLWMLIADAFALNATKAFWSNFERMEGWVLLIHLLGFFFAASSVLRAEKKWRVWFLTSIGASLIISGYALLQLAGKLAIHQGAIRIDATLGNSAYLAIYLLFSVFVALWLAFTERNVWLKWSLIAVAVLEGILIFFTETRGTILGLIFSSSLAVLLTALTAGGRARRRAAGAFALILVFMGAFYLARDSAFVRENRILGRVASISLEDGQTRFTIWGMAFEGVKERPLLGWGQEGFNYVFNKYYDPSLYQQEQWFDRAHNAFIDWLSAGGIPAFLLYLSLFGSALFLLWRRSELPRSERILLTAALTGYAIHNLFVFDNLYSYIYFFALLAFVDSQVGRPFPRLENAPALSPSASVTYALPIALVAVGAAIWFVNLTGMRAAGGLITAIAPSGNVETNIAAFEDFAAHPVFAMQEVREQMVSLASQVVVSPAVSDEQKRRMVLLAITEMQKQVEEYPLDARSRIQLSYAYRSAGAAQEALAEIKNALVLSPRKEQFFIEKGTTEWDLGDLEAARESFVTAYELAPQFSDLALYAAAGNIVMKDQKAANEILLNAFGTTTIDSTILSVAYYRAQDWPRLISLWKARTEVPGATPETWVSLAAAYHAAGRIAEAISTINATIAKYPDFATTGAAIIAELRGTATKRQ